MSTTRKHETAAPASPAQKPADAVKPGATGQANKNFQGLPFLFDKQNYLLMAAGLVVIILGYVLMSGGRSEDPNVFDADALYSFRRITLAPILIIIGLIIEGYAIMRRPSNN